jgi:hypothetical protein
MRARCTTLCGKVCQRLATGQWFSPCPPVSFTNETDRHDITEILLKVVLNTIKQINIVNLYSYSLDENENYKAYFSKDKRMVRPPKGTFF